jgi:peptidoglycan/LPS O-acetylase OafA/YrhL
MIYRREIDGLRALAIVPVILFHAGFKTFSGGYVGVDIFFVISGYLITSVIIDEKKAGTFSLNNFYERRVRRILPALFFVMLVCLPFAWYWLLPEDMKSFSQSLAAVPIFSSNISFWRTSGYFDASSELKPLLHTWSLAVEEQYYLVFPIFILLFWQLGRRWVISILVSAAFLSLALAQWWLELKPAFTFFMLPTRGWEILVGSCLAFYVDSKNKVSVSLFASQILGLIGLLLIGASIFLFNEGTPFPGVFALVPTIGAALVILYASSHTFIGKLLSTKALVSIGLISYSAYLWHQPLFAFARHRSIANLSGITLASLCTLTFFLSYLSWRFVEIPFRNKNYLSRKIVFTYTIFFSFFFLFFGMFGYLNNGYSFRKDFFKYLEVSQTARDSRCHTVKRKTAKQIAVGDICTLGKGNKPTFALIGDSHAGAIFEALGDYPFNQPTSFWAFSGGWCAPLLNGFDSSVNAGRDSDCRDTTKAAFDQIIKTKEIRAVFLVAEWANYSKGYRDDGVPQLYSDDMGKAKTLTENNLILNRSLLAAIGALKNAKKKFIL